MKRFLCATTLALFPLLASAADVGVSIGVNQPGIYGRIDIGGYPQPQFLYPEPVYLQPAPRGVRPQPLYLHVPPGHAKNWGKHCGRYNACSRPVYFVQEEWYRDVYAPRYREVQGRDDYRDHHDYDGDRKHGNGNGNGNGKHKHKKHD